MFAKVFQQIFDSSIVENAELRFTFMDMLVLADRNGVVDMTHEAIARRTNRPIEVIRQTIHDLESPDLRSRTPDYEGARIKRLDDHREWGWMILNYDHFRRIASEEQRREKTLARVQKFRTKLEGNGDREREGESLTSVTKALQGGLLVDVEPNRKRFSPPLLQEVEVKCEAIGLPKSEALNFINHHCARGWRLSGSKAPMVSWPHALGTWKTNYERFNEKSRPKCRMENAI